MTDQQGQEEASTITPATPTNNVHQIFQGSVENVAGRDVVITNEVGGRPLTKNERYELNDLVERLIKEFGLGRREPWTFLHRTIGVNNIDGLRLDHLKPARTLLQLMIEAKQAEGAVEEIAHWQREYLSSQQDLQEQGRELIQLNSSVRQWEKIGGALRLERDQLQRELTQLGTTAAQWDPQAYSALKSDRDRLQRELTQLSATIAQWDREKQSRSGEIIRLQQRLSQEMQAHQHAQDEIDRSAYRVAELERQVDSLIADKSSTAQALEEAQDKALQAQRVIRRLRGGLISGGVLAALAIGALGHQPVSQTELRDEQNKAVMLKRKDICLFNGEPFSWGARNKTATGMQKCVKSRNGQYRWQPER